MKQTCTITGYKFHTPLLNDLRLSYPHPIFASTLNDLLKYKTRITQADKPLYLIALLSHFPQLFIIGYTNYEAINNETLELIPRCINRLPTIAAYSHIQTTPRFAISTDNINNLANYLKELENTLIEYNQNAATRALAIKTKRRQEALDKLISRGSKSFTKNITEWCMYQLQLPSIKLTGAVRKAKNGNLYKSLEDYYYDLFYDIAKSPDNVFYYPKQDLDELYECVLASIPNTNDNALAVYSILNAAEREYNNLTIDFNMAGTVESRTIPIISEELIGAPQPKPKDYGTYTKYLIALSKWKVANNAY